MAEGHGYFSLGATEVSPDNRLLAFGMDTGGRLLYTIRFEDLATGKLLGDTIADVTSNLAWANDSKTLILFETGPEDPPRPSSNDILV
jgi:oligopeptidase B